MTITPGLTTITVEWHNETELSAKIRITIENAFFFRVSTCSANRGSRVIRSVAPAVTYTVTVMKLFKTSWVLSSSILKRQNVTLPMIGKMVLLIVFFGPCVS